MNDRRGGPLFGVNVHEPIARQRIGYLPEMTYYKFLTAELASGLREDFCIQGGGERRIDAVLSLSNGARPQASDQNLLEGQKGRSCAGAHQQSGSVILRTSRPADSIGPGA